MLTEDKVWWQKTFFELKLQQETSESNKLASVLSSFGESITEVNTENILTLIFCLHDVEANYSHSLAQLGGSLSSQTGSEKCLSGPAVTFFSVFSVDFHVFSAYEASDQLVPVASTRICLTVSFSFSESRV